WRPGASARRWRPRMRSGATVEDEPMADMNFIPLIDIALTLVIILMVTTAFIRQPGVSLKLPQTVTREGTPETHNDLIVNAAANGGLSMDGKPQTAADLQARLRQVAAKDKKARVLVRGDRAAVYARVMEVMDMVRQAGLTRVVLPTDPKSQTAPAATKPGKSRAA